MIKWTGLSFWRPKFHRIFGSVEIVVTFLTLFLHQNFCSFCIKIHGFLMHTWKKGQQYNWMVIHILQNKLWYVQKQTTFAEPRYLGESCQECYALSFYRSKNVLSWSKFFEPAQKIIYVLCQSQTFCARQKDDLHSAKLFFVPAQKFLKRH